MGWILDIEKAVNANYQVPTIGVFRAEKAHVVRVTEGNDIVVTLPDTMHPEAEYVVSQDCILSDGKDD
jgi:hypothetical protein